MLVVRTYALYSGTRFVRIFMGIIFTIGAVVSIVSRPRTSLALTAKYCVEYLCHVFSGRLRAVKRLFASVGPRQQYYRAAIYR